MFLAEQTLSSDLLRALEVLQRLQFCHGARNAQCPPFSALQLSPRKETSWLVLSSSSRITYLSRVRASPCRAIALSRSRKRDGSMASLFVSPFKLSSRLQMKTERTPCRLWAERHLSRKTRIARSPTPERRQLYNEPRVPPLSCAHCVENRS